MSTKRAQVLLKLKNHGFEQDYPDVFEFYNTCSDKYLNAFLVDKCIIKRTKVLYELYEKNIHVDFPELWKFYQTCIEKWLDQFLKTGIESHGLCVNEVPKVKDGKHKVVITSKHVLCLRQSIMESNGCFMCSEKKTYFFKNLLDS